MQHKASATESRPFDKVRYQRPRNYNLPTSLSSISVTLTDGTRADLFGPDFDGLWVRSDDVMYGRPGKPEHSKGRRSKRIPPERIESWSYLNWVKN